MIEMRPLTRSLAVARPFVVAACLSAALAVVVPPARAAQKIHSAEELFSPFLEGELSQWMIGPIGRLATEDEIDQYLRLKTADEAEQFIDAFWAKRDPDPSKPGNPVRELYDTRAAEADKKFPEAAVAGRRTDRGTIYVLYGDPEKTEYEEGRDVSGPDIELWRYPKKGEPGLDGRQPEKEYRFAKLGDLTRFYGSKEMNDQARRSKRNAEPGFPSSPGDPGDTGRGIPSDPGAPSGPP